MSNLRLRIFSIGLGLMVLTLICAGAYAVHQAPAWCETLSQRYPAGE